MTRSTAGGGPSSPLAGVTVVELSSGIAGGYAGKLLCDAGADVVKIETPEGDPLRRRAALAGDESAVPGRLFAYLAASKRSVVAGLERDDVAAVRELARRADVVVWSPGSALAADPELAPGALHEAAPGAVVVAITPFGLEGPWADAPASDLTLQAWSGGPAIRGRADGPPTPVGGDHSSWMGGMFAGTAALASLHRARRWGVGDLLDCSILESLVITQNMYHVTYRSIAGRPWRPARAANLPDIEATADGYAGFMVATAQMFQDFCVLVERPEWMDDTELFTYEGRRRRRDELQEAIDAWMSTRTTDEVVELASLFRIPVAPVANGASVTEIDHMIEHGLFAARSDAGFVQPAVPYRLHAPGVSTRPFGPAPDLGEHGTISAVLASSPAAPDRRPLEPAPDAGTELPFAGLRVLDFTAFWAGPMAGQFLAMLGADVIHIESPKRPDGIRGNTVKTVDDDLWWEWSPPFHGPNTNKRAVTIDMDDPRGQDIARRLVAESDVVLDNFSPRVLERWGLDYPSLAAIRPGLVMVRMPAFGLAGPWRDRTGYAQTMEQVSGLAWVSGDADGPPVTTNGACDPIAGTHATAALLVALAQRDRTGDGMLVEVPMVASALNVAAEQVVEHSAGGPLLRRCGSRGAGAPQGCYLTASIDEPGRDEWIALAVTDDEQWSGLVAALDHPAWASDPALATAVGRRAAHERIDSELAAWCAIREADDIVATLWPRGVPVGRVMWPHRLDELPQLEARGFYETVHHPITGANLREGYPARSSAGPDRLHRSPAPTLGQHNADVLTGLLGLSPDAVVGLADDGVVGTRPVGTFRGR